jgi:hypothetical protein
LGSLRVTIAKWVWKETAEVLGVVGIIAGIVFLGFELRQNNELMAAEARRAVLEISLDIWGQITDSPDLAAMLVNDRSGQALTMDEELRLSAFWMKTLSAIYWIHQENLDLEPFIGAHRRNFAAYGSYRRTWEGDRTGSQSAGKDNFDPAFVQFFEQNISNVIE